MPIAPATTHAITPRLAAARRTKFQTLDLMSLDLTTFKIRYQKSDL